MSDGPPASGSPWGSGAPAGPVWSAPPVPRRRVWPWVVGGVALVVLVLTAFAVVAALGVGWFVTTVRAPVDVANTYFAEAREGGVPATTCDDSEPPTSDVATSTGQDLKEVDVSGRQADVRGTITLADGVRTNVLVGLEQVDGEWCVADVRVGGS